MTKKIDYQEEPSPRLQYEGDVHPITKKHVLRIDRWGLIEARREIAESNPNHPALKNLDLWSDLKGSN